MLTGSEGSWCLWSLTLGPTWATIMTDLNHQAFFFFSSFPKTVISVFWDFFNATELEATYMMMLHLLYAESQSSPPSKHLYHIHAVHLRSYFTRSMTYTFFKLTLFVQPFLSQFHCQRVPQRPHHGTMNACSDLSTVNEQEILPLKPWMKK